MKSIIKTFTMVFLLLIIVACTPEVKTNTYTVSFNTNGGTPTLIDDQVRNEGSKVRMPVDPEKEDFEFLFWFNEQLDRAWEFDSDLVESDITLVAHYADISEEFFGVTFNYDIEGQTNMEVSVLENATVSEPKAILKEGYKFIGWYLEDVKFDFNSKVTSNLTLIAKYEEYNLELTLPEYVEANVTDKLEVPFMASVTITVNVPDDKVIKLFKVGDQVILSGNTHTFNIAADTLVVVEFNNKVYSEKTHVEDFSTLAAWKEATGENSSEYLDYLFTGTDGFDYDIVNGRIDLGMRQGDQGITLAGRGNEITQAGMGRIMLEDYENGLSKLEFEARLPFSPKSTYPQVPGKDKAVHVYISVYVNDERIARLQFDDDKMANKGQTFVLENLNYTGLTTFSIEVSSGHRLTIGSFGWVSNLNGVEEDLVEPTKIDFEDSKFDFDNDEATYLFNDKQFILKEVHTNIMHQEKEVTYMTPDNGSVVARFRGASNYAFSTPTAYMYNLDAFDYISEISFDAKQFGSNGYFAPDAKINIYYKLTGEEDFTLVETIDDLDEVLYKSYNIAIDQSDVHVKIEVVGGTLNIDNIIYEK